MHRNFKLYFLYVTFCETVKMARPLTVAPERYLYEYTKRITIQHYIFTSIFPVFRAMIDCKSYMHDFLDVAVKK